VTEWNWDDALAVRYEEGHEQLRKDKLEIARNLLAEDSTPEFVEKITGLSIDEIKKL